VEQTSFTPPSLEVLNELLPSYSFTNFIAQGGMGAVYRATQLSLDRDVAIKILHPELSQDPEFHKSFRTESRAMAQLNHPNLIGIYDFGELNGMLYIVMEYVAGKSLYHSCWNKQIDPEEVKRIIIAICEGLHHAHESGFIHRDIKPANILLTPKVEPKIGDFGLVQAMGSKFEGIVMGTPGYSAPEIISHPEKMDRRSDIFAVGVILYEMLVGKLPVGSSLPSKECNCSAAFDTIYQNATHPNAAMRYPDAKKLSEALQAMKEGVSSAPRLVSAPPRIGSAPSRGPVKLGSSASTTPPSKAPNPLSKSAPGARPMTVAKPMARPSTVAQASVPEAAVPEAVVPDVVSEIAAPEAVVPEVAIPPVEPKAVVAEASIPPSVAAKANVAQRLAPKAVAPPASKLSSPARAATPRSVAAKDDDEEDDGPLVIPTFSKTKTVSSWPLVRNMMLICILLVACVFAYQKLEIHRNNIRQQEEDFARKEKEKQMAAKIANAAQNNNTQQPKQRPDGEKSKPTPAPPPETPMEELEHLRFSLSRGDRTVMPKSSKRRGDFDYFLVKEEMTWDEAFQFCEQHGAHIAYPSNEDDLSFLSGMLTGDETVWMGSGKAGRDEWYLISGAAWPLPKKPAGAGNIATLSYLGIIQASNSDVSRPFLMCWYRDGSTPHTLESLLSVTSKSLDTPNPQYPPGTVVMGSRMFLPILRELSFSEAQTLASASGGHIAALSTKDEGFWLEEAVASGQAPKGIWLNGELKSGAWGWSTGEAWTYASWATDYPTEDEDDSQLAFIPGKGWINVSPSEDLDGVLIEWSKDASAAGSKNAASVDTGAKDLKTLQEKAQILIKKTAKEREEKHAANIKKFHWDMDIWLRGVRTADQAAWRPSQTHIKEQCKEKIVEMGKIYGEQDLANVHPEMTKIHAYNFKKQQEIDETYLASITKIRDSYANKIKEFGTAARSAGQTQVVEKLKELLEDTEDPESWADSLLRE